MNGFAGGALAGAVVGAAALAGLSIYGPRDTQAVLAAPEAVAVPAAKAVPRPAEAVPPVAEVAVGPAPGEAAEASVALATVTEDVEPEAAGDGVTAGPADPFVAAPTNGIEAESAPSLAPDLAAGDPEGGRFGTFVLAEVAPVLPGPEAALSPEAALALVEAPPAPEAAPLLPEPAPVEEATAPVGPTAGEAPAGEIGAMTEPEGEPTPTSLPGRVAVGGRALPGGGPVRVNRPGVEEAAVEAEPEVPPEAPPADAPALQRHAAAWEAPDAARPLLSLVLLDDGATDPLAVAGLPWPVSVALDPEAQGAAERLAAYRAAGVEALVLARLPAGATPVDVEVFLGAALDRLPETVGVLDLGEGGLGGRDAVAQMAMSRVARDGRGVVLGDRGFRSGLDLATRAGVPAAEILRDLDGEGQDAAAIGRGLDDAVRRAGQEGRAVVLGRVGPGTLAALAEWSQEGRAQEVTVAPVSGVLEAE